MAIDPDRQPRRTGTGRSASARPRGDLSSAAIAAKRLGSALDRPSGRDRAPASRRAAPEPRWGVPAFMKRVRPVKALTTVMFSAALVGIVANAVLLQKGHHPASPFDLLRGGPPPVPTPVARPADTADAGVTGAVASAPAQPPAPVAPATAESDPAPAPAPAPASPHRAIAPRHAAAKPVGADAIGQFLSGGTPAASAKPAGKTAEAKPTETKPAEVKPIEAKSTEARTDPALLRTQRQLKKLGYDVTADGRLDGGTRQAIKHFAHDHHLKAEAALTPELRRQIADASAAPAKPAAAPAPKAQ